MRGQDLAADPHEGFGEDAAREAMVRARGRSRLRQADLALGALIFVLCIAILANALAFQAPSVFSPLPPHRPGTAEGAPDKTRSVAVKPSAATPSAPARAAAPSGALGGMTEGTLGYLIGRTTAVNTPAPASATVPPGGANVRRPLSAIGAAPEPEITGAVRPPVDVPGASRVRAVQRTLARLGYGPLKVDGQPGAQTRLAIQRFQRDRNLTADGQISDRLVGELSTVSGAAID